MTIRCLFLFLVMLHIDAEGQVHSVKLLNTDTTICAGNSLRLTSSFSIGSFRYFGTYGGKDYFIDTISRTWTAAKEAAAENGLDLWVIDNLAENNAVFNLIPNAGRENTYFWFGLYQDQAIGATGGPTVGWKWIDGRSLDTTFSYWYTNEPDNTFLDKGDAAYASLGLLPTGSKWSDMPDVVPVNYGGYAILEAPASTIRIEWLPTGDINKTFIDPKPNTTTTYKAMIRYRGVEKQSNEVKVLVSSPKAKASFEVDPLSINCLTQNNFNFINTSVSGEPDKINYKWDFGDGNVAMGFLANHQYSGVQTYTVKLFATDELGCSSVASNTVSVLASPLKPIISIVSGAVKFCTGDSVLLTSVVQQPDPAAVYKWFNGTTLVNNTKSITLTLSGTYTLEVTNKGGCTDTAIIRLSTLQRPSRPSISTVQGFTAVFCEGDSTMLQALTGTEAMRYKWAIQDAQLTGTLDGESSSSIKVKTPGSVGSTAIKTQYVVAVTDLNNCSSDWSMPFDVSVLPSPPVSISTNGASTVVCDGNLVSITASSTAVFSRVIWFRDRDTLTDGLGMVWKASKTGVYQVKATNSFSCQRTSNTIDVLVNKLPTSPVIRPSESIPDIVSAQEVRICPGTAGILKAPVFSGVTYQWYKDGIAINSAWTDSLVVTSVGNYKVSISMSGCSSMSNEMKVGLLALPNGTMVNPEFPVICLGSSQALSASGASGYQWYYNYVPIQGATQNKYTAATPGVYQVEFSSDKGCKKMSPNFISLSLIRKPTPRFSVDIYCTGSVATFTNLSQTANSGSVQYLWKFQNGQSDSNFTAKHTFSSSGLYKVCLDVIPIACPQLRDSSVVNIQIEAAPPAITYPAINSMIGKSISLVARPIGDFYEWKPNVGMNSPYIRIPILNTPLKEQLYTVDITTRSGCRTVDSQFVRVFDEQEIFVAGGFTPNNDGKNDKIYPILVGVSAFRYMKIFNRWGIQVFQTSSTDPEQGWDGTFKGIPQPADTYTWVISAVGDNEKEIRKSGSLVLIR